MKKIDNDIKMIVSVFIAIIGIFIIGFIGLVEKDRLNEIIKEKNELIESQAKLLIENEYNNCYCGFFEDFYYEYADDVGAFE